MNKTQEPFRLLALHVLKQAIADNDRVFFRRENPMLSFWCSLARLSAAGLSEKISKKTFSRLKTSLH